MAHIEAIDDRHVYEHKRIGRRIFIRAATMPRKEDKAA